MLTQCLFLRKLYNIQDVTDVHVVPCVVGLYQ